MSYTTPEGTEFSDTYWPWDFAEREEAFDPVPGGSMSYLLAGLIVTAAGMLLVLGGRLIKRPQVELAAAVVPVVGLVMAIHAHALWAGRSVATMALAFLGTDGPSASHTTSFHNGDYYTSFMAISPLVVLPLLLATAWFLFGGLAVLVQKGDAKARARDHGRAGRWALIALALVFVLPWSVEELDDRFPPAEGATADKDDFVFSMYDMLRLNQDTAHAADAIGEAGLESYAEMAWLHTVLIVALAIAAGAALAGIYGAYLSTANEAVTGRMFESGVYLNVLAIGAALLGIALGAILWTNNNERIDASPLYVPLLAAIALIPAIRALVGVLRDLLQGEDGLIADDFPEPIIYD